VARVTASCADITRQVFDQEAARTAEIARQRDEIETLLAEIQRMHTQLDAATGVTPFKPQARTIDKLRREASRLERQARRIVRDTVFRHGQRGGRW